MLYLVENRCGWIESPIVPSDLKKGDKIIAVFNNDLFYTDEEQFERFADFVYQQEGKHFHSYTVTKLKELHKMWLETLQ